MLRLKLEVIEETWVNGTEYMCEVWDELQQELAMLEDLRTSWPPALEHFDNERYDLDSVVIALAAQLKLLQYLRLGSAIVYQT
ncbi:hypothetical protein VSDG_10187 [Cytospora chrysosperma]|uniref:Dilute domain-containing protein n=1 Tax=Cytospora chrysosperma TaxID=252740 RepID=A0A423V894_CYTCH|nr:hypothetical protein VSDG_10187 [Valsa sordida]